jgi:hypothetical protein
MPIRRDWPRRFSVNPGPRGPLRYELCQPCLPRVVCSFHAAEAIGRDIQRRGPLFQIHFPSERGGTHICPAHDYPDGEGLFCDPFRRHPQLSISVMAGGEGLEPPETHPERAVMASCRYNEIQFANSQLKSSDGLRRSPHRRRIGSSRYVANQTSTTSGGSAGWRSERIKCGGSAAWISARVPASSR